MTVEGPRFALSVDGSPAGIGRVVEAFDGFSAAHGVPDAARRAVQVVLDELLSNTVRCGKPDGRELTIRVGFLLDGERLTVEIVDDGTPFDPLAREAPDTTLPLEKRPVGGLGLLFVRSLVDGITYDAEGGRNRVVFGKRLGA
ncbi:MAG: ATP-binding protein [Thermoanaerobaculia bacterium]